MRTKLLHGHEVGRVGAALALGAATLIACATAANAQTLSIEDALSRAEAHAYANRIASAQAAERSSLATATLRGILPSVRVEAGYVRTTDPIGAFGTTLRQRTITQADFDPARLNYPGATSNYAGSLVVEQPLFNADAHLGRRAARRAGAAADAQADWGRSGTRLDVIRAYYGAVLAAEMVHTLEAAHAAALAHVDQAGVLVRAGMATRSDALLAEVKAGEVEVQLIEARDRAELARRQLAVLLAMPAGDAPLVPSALPSAASVEALLAQAVEAEGAAARSDVTAAVLGESAAHADAARATSLHLPRVNAFARYDWNSPSRLYGGDENWTVGVMATWTVFGGASTWAERRAAGARAEAAQAAAEATQAQAALEIESTARQRTVALARLDIAQRAVRQSEEAHRIVSRKYGGGLATVLEVLDAAAVETQAKLSLAGARHAGVVAAAEHFRATGLDPAEITQWLKPELVGMGR